MILITPHFRVDEFACKDGRAEAALLARLAQRTWKMEGRT